MVGGRKVPCQMQEKFYFLLQITFIRILGGGLKKVCQSAATVFCQKAEVSKHFAPSV